MYLFVTLEYLSFCKFPNNKVDFTEDHVAHRNATC